ncbi:MAG: hypothetical protein PHX83_16105 [Acidobacteriia bacterium]|nr:hypothetical protein [Terriglobia bacterium]
MLFSWNEIRHWAIAYEKPVKKLSGDWIFIDLFWSGRLLAEHKSAAADLSKARARHGLHLRLQGYRVQDLEQEHDLTWDNDACPVQEFICN